MAEVLVKPERVARAKQVIAQNIRNLTEGDLLELFDYIGDLDLYRCLEWTEHGKLKIKASNIQLIAIAACVAAVAEYGMVMVAETAET